MTSVGLPELICPKLFADMYQTPDSDITMLFRVAWLSRQKTRLTYKIIMHTHTCNYKCITIKIVWGIFATGNSYNAFQELIMPWLHVYSVIIKLVGSSDINTDSWTKLKVLTWILLELSLNICHHDKWISLYSNRVIPEALQGWPQQFGLLLWKCFTTINCWKNHCGYSSLSRIETSWISWTN